MTQPKRKPAAKPKAQRPPSAKEDPILTISEVAVQIGKHRNTVSRWIAVGAIHAGKHPSGAIGIRQSVVDEYLRHFPVGKPKG